MRQTPASRTLLSWGCYSGPAVPWQSCISAVFETGQEERLPGLGVQETSPATTSPHDRCSAAAQLPPDSAHPSRSCWPFSKEVLPAPLWHSKCSTSACKWCLIYDAGLSSEPASCW